MITEQVRRIQAGLRACGFKRGEFQVRAERTRKTDRSSGMRYTEFGPAAGITNGRAGREVVERAFEQRFALRDQGFNVVVYEQEDGRVAWIIVSEPRYRQEPSIYRRAHTPDQWEEKS
jgi:hypothetical protein